MATDTPPQPTALFRLARIGTAFAGRDQAVNVLRYLRSATGGITPRPTRLIVDCEGVVTVTDSFVSEFFCRAVTHLDGAPPVLVIANASESLCGAITQAFLRGQTDVAMPAFVTLPDLALRGGVFLIDGASGDDAQSPIVSPRPLCARDLYARETVEETYTLWRLYPFVPEVPICDIPEDGRNARVEVRVIDSDRGDYERDGWTLASVWFDKRPVMIIQEAGRGEQDHQRRFVTDTGAYADMARYLSTLVAIDVEDPQDFLDPDTPDIALTSFGNRDLDDPVQVQSAGAILRRLAPLHATRETQPLSALAYAECLREMRAAHIPLADALDCGFDPAELLRAITHG